MRRIAIIGSGQAGLLAAHALLKAGNQITLYSDKTPEQWLTQSSPTGTAVRFDLSLQFERELGLNFWDEVAPSIDGLHFTMCPVQNTRLLTMAGRTQRPALAIDLRLQSHRWTLELAKRGGRVEYETISVARLDEIAAENDLCIVATGRSELCRLFERNAERSVFDKPQRHLTMVCVKGPLMGFDGIPVLPVKFNMLGGVGEIFFAPYYHKDVGPSWNLIFEAVPGGPLDQFQGATSGDQVLEIAKAAVRKLIPWDYDWLKNSELSDPRGWLVGKFAPTVRDPVGRLPSGRIVTALGDTAMSMDPVAGQGANNGNKMARNLAECVIAHGDRPFDAQWMTETFERFYVRHGYPTYTFSHTLLQPPGPALRDLFFAQYGSDARAGNVSGPQLLANTFAESVNDPLTMLPYMTNRSKMRQMIEEVSGQSWIRLIATGAMGVAWEGLRQLRGLEPRHPLVPEYKVAA